ncbi:hypothetical protein BUALT_Bualt06G0002500 [Buddleja alternifolia]|uniref:Uncharacterized protein n=1 Tax=Buddleja alternifolia TaxID=168488 RepID=A0AAV6XJX2_9LAMI|nr:hypothetical protein BUALT_Bualt06G0002500 [Buddleja alternifolia]
MWKDKSPGLKILWLWTFGTAAVLVTNVVRTRVRDMDQFTNSQDQTPHVADKSPDDNGLSSEVILEDKS